MSIQTQINIKNIVESKSNPRTIFDEAAMNDLVLSIESVGVKDPITVRSTDGLNYEVVYGHRRLRASKILKLESIPCYIVEMTEKDAKEARLREAILHERLTPMEEAKAFESFADGLKTASNKEIGLFFGKTPRYIAERRQLSKLSSEFKELLIKGTLSLSCAYEICKLLPVHQAELLKIVKGSRWLLNDEDRLIGKIGEEFLLDLSAAPWKKDDAALLPSADACNVCLKTSAANADLFVVKKKTLCLDSTCYKAKLAAYIKIKQKEYEDDDKELLLISNSYRPASGVIGNNDWNSRPIKEAKHYGIKVESGEIIGIRLSGEKESSGGTKSEPSFADRMQRYERRMQLHNGRVEAETRKQLLKDILPKITKVTKEDLLLLAKWVKNETAGDEDLIAEALQIDTKAFDGGSKEDKLIASLHEHQLIRLLLGIAITTDEMVNDPAYVPEDEKLTDLSKRYKVDRIKIYNKYLLESKPKEPKKPVKEEKPAPAKKAAKKVKKSKK